MTIRERDVIGCLPLLASVLGRKYGVQVRIGGEQAATDGKVIRLPALPSDCGNELLRKARGYIDHESAHIRHTDFTALKAAQLDAVTHHLWNSIEDWRVEQKLSALYPGCRANLNRQIRDCLMGSRNDAARAGEQSPALDVLNYVLLSVRAWDVPEVMSIRLPLEGRLRQTWPGLLPQLDAILARIRRDCPDTTAAIAYARQLADCIRQWKPPQQNADAADSRRRETEQEDEQDNRHEGRQSAPGGASGSADCGEEPDRPESHASAEQTDADAPGGTILPGKSMCGTEATERGIPGEPADSVELGDDDDASVLRKDGGRPAGQLPAGLFSLPDEELPPHLGDVLQAGLTASAEKDIRRRMDVAATGPLEVNRLDGGAVREAMRSCNALRHRLHGLLQAQKRATCSIGRYGTLHTRSLYRLAVGNPKVFLRASAAPGLNTAVHILLDASSSMAGDSIKLAGMACYAAAKALETINGVNVAVTCFPAGSRIGEGTVKPLVRHGEKVTSRMAPRAAGGTPLAPSLWWVMQTLCAMREDRKIILVLTDGEPDAVPPCILAIRQARRLGMEVYGIGIRSNAVHDLLPGRSRVINKLPELAPAMFGMLQSALLQGGRA